jgi:hypothetical protein
MRSNLTNLVRDAMAHGEATASDGKWRAYRDPCERGKSNPYRDPYYAVEVWHHATAMIRVYGDGEVIGLDPGYGSTTDRCGIRRVTAGFNGDGGTGYRDLFAA